VNETQRISNLKKLIKDVASYLRKECPPMHPVRILVKELPKGTWGDCELKEGKNGDFFLVRISNKLSPDGGYLVLVHEWAHVLAENKEKKPHDKHWGIEYAKIWRNLTDEKRKECTLV
tara:strand:- start:332 stop:685 length:354 start_codon:yes stop_codon:yes gene_type:complete